MPCAVIPRQTWAADLSSAASWHVHVINTTELDAAATNVINTTELDAAATNVKYMYQYTF